MTTSDVPPFALSQHEPVYRRNFVFFMIDNTLFTVALSIIGATTVIPDFIAHLTDSKILIGLAGSLFGIGWTLPQIFVARYMMRVQRKKWWFVGPNIPIRFVILIFAGIVILLGKSHLEAILVAFFICYGIAGFGDGIVGVPWADLAGTSLDNRWRARMFGVTSALSGLIMLGVTPIIAIILSSAGPTFPNNYGLVFGVAGVVFIISILPGMFFHELPGGKVVEKIPSLGEFLPQLTHVLRTDASFRAMTISRLLAALFAVAAPFYIGFATERLGLSSDIAVPVLLAMQTIGFVLGALLYTWLGARNNLLYIRLALAGSLLMPIGALFATVVGPLPLYLGFLMSGVTLSNLLSAYVNWVVTYAEHDHRPIYMGLFNTVTALISVVAPFLAGTIAQQLGYEVLFVSSLAMGGAALFVAVRYVF